MQERGTRSPRTRVYPSAIDFILTYPIAINTLPLSALLVSSSWSPPPSSPPLVFLHADQAPTFSARVYGSVALCLCEPQSDLDLCIVTGPGAFKPPFVEANEVLRFADLDPSTQARHWLQTVVSRCLGDSAQVRGKEEIFGASVPLLRVQLSGPVFVIAIVTQGR